MGVMGFFFLTQSHMGLEIILQISMHPILKKTTTYNNNNNKQTNNKKCR